MNQKNITFSSNGFTLKGTLHLPDAEHPPVVIGSHGLFSSGSSPKQIALAKRCNACGIAFFRFDHRGCGQSQGIFQEVTTLEARCNDMISAIKTIQNRNDTGNRIGLFGSSMGGAVCLSVFAASHAWKNQTIQMHSHRRFIEDILIPTFQTTFHQLTTF
jgi:alpha-beta hydrolase superfamily lysophospholipase